MTAIDEQALIQKRFEASKAQLTQLWVDVQDDHLMKICNRMRTIIANKDAMLVSQQDAELETVWTNFVEKRLGVASKEEGMELIHAIMNEYKSSEIKMKERCGFYYYLAQKTGKLEELYEKKSA